MRTLPLALLHQQAGRCACALANCAEVNRGLASSWCCLLCTQLLSDGNWEPGGENWEQPGRAGDREEQRGRLWLPLWVLTRATHWVRSPLWTGLSLFASLAFAISFLIILLLSQPEKQCIIIHNYNHFDHSLVDCFQKKSCWPHEWEWWSGSLRAGRRSGWGRQKQEGRSPTLPSPRLDL